MICRHISKIADELCVLPCRQVKWFNITPVQTHSEINRNESTLIVYSVDSMQISNIYPLIKDNNSFGIAGNIRSLRYFLRRNNMCNGLH